MQFKFLEASQNGSHQPFSVELEVSSTSSSKRRSEVSIQIQQQLPTSTEEVLEEALDGDEKEEEGKDKGEDVIIRRVIVRPWKPD